MDPLTSESFPVILDSNHCYTSYEVKPPKSTVNSLSADVHREREETLLAGLGLKNLFRFSEYAQYLTLSRSQAHASQPMDSPSYVFVFPITLFLSFL